MLTARLPLETAPCVSVCCVTWRWRACLQTHPPFASPPTKLHFLFSEFNLLLILCECNSDLSHCRDTPILTVSAVTMTSRRLVNGHKDVGRTRCLVFHPALMMETVCSIEPLPHSQDMHTATTQNRPDISVVVNTSNSAVQNVFAFS